MARNAPLILTAVALLLALVPASGGRAEEAASEAVLGFLAPRRGEAIADVGCGSGTWTVPLAQAVGPTGRVLAVDIDPEAIARTRSRVRAAGLEHVETIQSLPDDPCLPADSLDAIFLNNVIDWVERRALAGFLAGIRQALRPDGRLVIRDPNGGADRVISELYRAGFSLVEARIPLESAPEPSFTTGSYALKLRRADVQPAILPRLGRPARYRVRLHLAEELYRLGLLTREELRARWEELRDQPGPFDPSKDEALDLIRAAQAVGVLDASTAQALEARVRGA